jgi:chitosanase
VIDLLRRLLAWLLGPRIDTDQPVPLPPPQWTEAPVTDDATPPADNVPTAPPAQPRVPPVSPRDDTPPPREDDTVPDKFTAKKPVIQSILSVFETGKPEGDYGAVAVLHDGAGISYGLHQVTDRAGQGLDEVVRRYIVADGARYADELAPYLPRLERDDTAAVDPDNLPAWVVDLMDLLSDAGRQDPVMQRVQDGVFDERYWQPAVDQCVEMQLELPLSWAVVYDSCIHSGPSGVGRIRRRFPEGPPSKGGDEQAWVVAYLAARYEWLSTHQNAAVRRSAQRILQLQGLVEAGNWQLDTPFTFGRPYSATITAGAPVA